MRPLAFVLGLLLVGCGPSSGHDSEPRIIDQSGAEFLLVEGKVRRIDGVSPPVPSCDDDSGRYLLGVGRFEMIIGFCSDHALGDWSRIVVCEDDSDCAELPCHAGFCQDTSLGMPGGADMNSLCYGEADRFSSEPFPYDPEIELALDQSCPRDGPCTSIPAGCPDPT